MRLCRVIQRVLLTLLAIGILAICGLMFFGLRPAVVTSGSMEPTIPTGSLCFYNIKAPQEQIKEGDIIVFRAGADDPMLVTHRVISKTAIGYRTKGDKNKSADPGLIPLASLEGKTMFWIPHAGALCTWPGRILVLAICAALFCFNLLDREHQGKEDAL